MFGGILQGFLQGITGSGSGIVGENSGSPEYMINISTPGTHISAYLPENFSSSVNSDYDTPFAEGIITSERAKLAVRVAGVGTTTQIMSMQVWQGTAPIEFSIPLTFLYDSDTEKDVMGPVRSLMSLTLPSTFGSGNSALSTSSGSLSGSEGLLISPGPKLRPRDATITPKDLAGKIKDDVVDTATGAKDVVLDTFGNNTTEGLINTPINEIGEDELERIGRVFAGYGILSLADVVDNISLAVGNFLFFPSVVITDVSSDYSIKLSKQSKKPISLEVTVSFRTFVTPKVEDLTTMVPR